MDLAKTASTPSLVLASASPRRRDLLTRAGLAFQVIPSKLPEELRAGEAARNAALRLAEAKARDVAEQLPANPKRWVLGADTLVVLDDVSLGKPRDPEQALAFLKQLTGRSHTVVTAVTVLTTCGDVMCSHAFESRVTMRQASEQELRDYVASGESLDKAGGYAAQGAGRQFIERIDGSESNVIGLPVEETLALLQEAGYSE